MTARYDPVAVTLHWVTALTIIAMIPFGFFMGDLPITLKFSAYALHKSIGLTVLTLSIFRLVWRLLNPPPALPAGMKPYEVFAAKATHWLFYALIIAMPLTGWLMVSASQKYPTIFFWLGEVPFLPMPEGIDKKETAHLFNEYHELLAFGAIALILLHVGAALKHHFVNRDTVLTRMLPRFMGGRNA